MNMRSVFHALDIHLVDGNSRVRAAIRQKRPILFIGKTDRNTGFFRPARPKQTVVDIFCGKFFADQLPVAIVPDLSLKYRMQTELSNAKRKQRRAAAYIGIHNRHFILLPGFWQTGNARNNKVYIYIAVNIDVPFFSLHSPLHLSFFHSFSAYHKAPGKSKASQGRQSLDFSKNSLYAKEKRSEFHCIEMGYRSIYREVL